MPYIETQKVELKEKINDSLPKEIESFLNTDGGTIYIGVSDDGQVLGIDKIDQGLKKISEIISDQIEPSAIDCVKPEAFYEDGKFLIRINVAKGIQPLYCIKKHGYSSSGCHLRVGTSCKAMTAQMIRLRFRFQDLLIKTPTTYGPLSFKILKLFFTENGFHINDKTFETNHKLRTIDKHYNLLAELLADHNSFPFIFVKFEGKDKTAISQRNDYGRISLLTTYEKIKTRLIAENICIVDTTVRPRKETYLFDMDAVNEALVNALVHNDYILSQPLISMFEDRLEILSHGGLPHGLSKDEFFLGVSRPLNEALMEILTKTKVLEHTGHGVPVIVSKYSKEVFDIHDSFINVVIPFNKEVMKSINHNYQIERESLKSKEKTIYEKLYENHHLTSYELCESLDIPHRSVQRYLDGLKKKAYIKRVGSNKTGYWEIL